MNANDFLDELNMLTSRSDLKSLDPTPPRETGMDSRLLRDRISDHLSGLRRLNQQLPRSQELDAALDGLVNAYEALLGRRLTELKTISSQAKSAVLELRRRLAARIKEDDPDLSYRGIDLLMRKICKSYDCGPSELHDAFVDTFLVTPDQWVKDQLNK